MNFDLTIRGNASVLPRKSEPYLYGIESKNATSSSALICHVVHVSPRLERKSSIVYT